MDTKATEIIKQEGDQIEPAPKAEDTVENSKKEVINYFQCSSCLFREKYEYFGRNPPYIKNYILLEDAYIMEDPFVPPKQGKIIILGAHCVKCSKRVCKDVNCSLFFDYTYCIQCAKSNVKYFPPVIQEKLNRIV